MPDESESLYAEIVSNGCHLVQNILMLTKFNKAFESKSPFISLSESTPLSRTDILLRSSRKKKNVKF